MAFDIEDINAQAASDPKGLLLACDRDYDRRVEQVGDMILENLSNSPIVLLSGPSGSGKTTTAMKLRDALSRRGVKSHSISMDNYFRTVRPETVPRTPEGEPDLESPACLDMDLLNEHFTRLTQGERIFVPKYEFSRRMRIIEPSASLRLGKNEVAIFEGIHALNDSITTVHPEAFKLYVSASSNFVDDDGEYAFKASWLRLVRRVVRDSLFRGTDPEETMQMWANVRRGERQNIDPFRHKADVQLNTAFPYEVCVLRQMAIPLFSHVPEGIPRREEMLSAGEGLTRFVPIDPALLAPDAMIREFTGGGIYEY
ncbi:MAG: nucleoside kinase [Oscillospiraceae bacterium]|nr:nucleoside kinase [Oscillospiraceae bacterium]